MLIIGLGIKYRIVKHSRSSGEFFTVEEMVTIFFFKKWKTLKERKSARLGSYYLDRIFYYEEDAINYISKREEIKEPYSREVIREI